MREWTGSKRSAEEKEAGLIAAIEAMEPGTYLIVEHPGMDTDEMRAMGHKGYENVAADRDGVTRALTSAKVKAAIQSKGVKLIRHLDLPAD
jgi:chitin disaccharide deacetylase